MRIPTWNALDNSADSQGLPHTTVGGHLILMVWYNGGTVVLYVRFLLSTTRVRTRVFWYIVTKKDLTDL